MREDAGRRLETPHRELKTTVSECGVLDLVSTSPDPEPKWERRPISATRRPDSAARTRPVSKDTNASSLCFGMNTAGLNSGRQACVNTVAALLAQVPVHRLLETLALHEHDAGAVLASLRALHVFVAYGHVSEPEVLRVVLSALRVHPDAPAIAAAGHAVLSATALRGDDAIDVVLASRVETGAVEGFLSWEACRQKKRERVRQMVNRLKNQCANKAFASWSDTTTKKKAARRMLAGWCRRELVGALTQWARGAVLQHLAQVGNPIFL